MCAKCKITFENLLRVPPRLLVDAYAQCIDRHDCPTPADINVEYVNTPAGAEYRTSVKQIARLQA